jgi:thiol-disulfide isomerase/thioredoxin
MGLYTGTSVKELNCALQTENGKLKPEFCKGRYGLIKFYAPNCGYCTGMHRDMTILASELRRYNFDVFAVDITNPSNAEIRNRMRIDSVPRLYMYNPEGVIMSIDDYLNNSREIPNLISVISKVTTGEIKLTNKKYNSRKTPSNCSILCDYTNDKMTCKTEGECYKTKSSGGSRRKSKKQ